MKIFLMPLFMAIILTGCKSDSTISVSPKKDEKKSFWIVTHSELANATLQSKTLVNYTVKALSPNIELSLKPEYFQVSRNNDSMDSNDSSRKFEDYKKLISAGFNTSIDPNTGEILETKALDVKAEKVLSNLNDIDITKLLADKFEVPYIIADIPKESGKTIELKSFSQFPANLTVISVSDELINAEINGKNSDGEIYANVDINLNDGHLNQALIIKKHNIMTPEGFKPARTRVLITRNSEDILNFSYFLHHENGPWLPIIEAGEKWNEETPKESDVFAYKRGYFQRDNNTFSLFSFHNLNAPDDIRGVGFSDIKAYNKNGEEITFDFAKQDLDFMINYSDLVSSLTGITPIGWENKNKTEQISKFTANFHFTPYSISSENFTWSDSKEQFFKFENIDLKITELDSKRNIYKFHFISKNSKYQPLLRFNGLKGKMQYDKIKSGPDWLSSGEQFASATYKNREQISIKVKLEEKPKEVSFLLATLSDEKLKQKLEFIPSNDFSSSLDNPPLHKSYLHPSSDFYESEPEAIEFDVNNPAKMDQTGQRSIIELPAEWSLGCKAEVTDASPVNGHSLIWSKVKKCTYCNTGQQLEHYVLELTTDDGEQRYFYDNTVTSKLSCSERAEWMDLGYTPNSNSWLISLKDLHGVDPDQSVSDFLRQYRFLDYEGRALGIWNEERDTFPLDEVSVGEVLIKSKYIHVAGRVNKILNLQKYKKASVTSEWSTSFPPLP